MSDSGREPLHEMSRELATAGGILTLVVRGGTLVTSGEIMPNMSVAAHGLRIAYVGPNASHTIGDETRVIGILSTSTATSRAPSFQERYCRLALLGASSTRTRSRACSA